MPRFWTFQARHPRPRLLRRLPGCSASGAGVGGVRPVAGGIAGLPPLREAGCDDVGYGGLGGAGDRRAGVSSSDSAATVSADVRLRGACANPYGPAAAEADSQRHLRHLDLGACLVGQVCVVQAHGAVAGATRPVRFGLAGRYHQRRAAADRTAVASDLRGVAGAESAGRIPLCGETLSQWARVGRS